MLGWRQDPHYNVTPNWEANFIFMGTSLASLIIFHVLLTILSKYKANMYFRFESRQKEIQIQKENNKKVKLLEEDNEVHPWSPNKSNYLSI